MPAQAGIRKADRPSYESQDAQTRYQMPACAGMASFYYLFIIYLLSIYYLFIIYTAGWLRK